MSTSQKWREPPARHGRLGRRGQLGRRGLATRVVGALALLGLLLAGGCTVWRLGQARDLVRASQPYQQEPAQPRLRLLVVGDSTAVGTGASQPAFSVAGLLGQAYPRLLVHNRARDGARFDEVPAQLMAAPAPGAAAVGYDLVLISAGGNDVIRGTDESELTQALDASFAAAQARLRPGGRVVVQPAGNVGNASFFLPPLTLLMCRRSRSLHLAVAAAAARQGVAYVNLYKEADQDPFALRPGLHAADGLHPSDAGYRVWFDELLAQTDLAARLQAAR